MSSALPCGTPSTTSNSTTSPSSLRPASSASVPPIWPAPISAILLRAMAFLLRAGRRASYRDLAEAATPEPGGAAPPAIVPEASMPEFFRVRGAAFAEGFAQFVRFLALEIGAQQQVVRDARQ